MAKWNGTNNCYGYALNIPKWLLFDDGYHGDDGISQLLNKNPNLELVDRDDLVLGKEYIAFRIAAHDFHFAKRGKDGHWRHKMGGSPVEALSTKKVFSKKWDFGTGNIYNSKLYLFEVRESW